MHTVPKRLVFVVGGPYGFSEAVYKAASEKISLSKMTFSHQMIRLIFIEQIYRAMTILNNEPLSSRVVASVNGSIGVALYLYCRKLTPILA